MEILTNVSLKDYTTMKIGGNARFIANVTNIEELETVCNNAKSQNLPIFVIGGGSNLIGTDQDYNGIIIKMQIPGFEIIADDQDSTTTKIGAGEDWDFVVKRTVDLNLGGIEAMSAIPGTSGAAPVQNVGAYGQEIADTLQSLEAYDLTNNQFVILSHDDCKFAYRDSIFRNEAKGRYIITSITIKLSKIQPKPPFYESLQRYLDENNITEYTVATIRNAVMEIRKNKLPDPKVMASSGSFFKNAIVNSRQIDELKSTYPNIPSFDMGANTYKIPTGWLIERAGLKGQLINGMRVYNNNALVLVNESANSYNDLANARGQIVNKIHDMFNIQIEQEPLEIR